MTLQTLQLGMEWFADFPGGLNRVYAHLLTELTTQGVETYGLVAGRSDVEQRSQGLMRAFAPPDAPLLARLRAVRAAALPWLRAHGEDAVIVSHFAMYAFPLLDQTRNHPFVVHFQGPWGQESRVEGASHTSVMTKEFVERRVYHCADAAIVLSAAFADILATRFGVQRDRIHMIPGGVESARFASTRSRAECRAQLRWPTDRPITLCVRRLVRRVGLDALIEAAVEVRQRVPDALIMIAGTGPMAAELSALIERRGLHDSVKLLGFIPDAQLPAAYRAADLTIVPSIALEGFGLSAVESLAAGTPCIVTPVGGLSEIVTPFAPQLVAASPLAADIAETLASTLLGQRDVPDSAACANYARATFDWPIIAARVRGVYEQVIR
jgi:glycosyltransferase involved in cell wall biosynthesis